MAGLISRGFLGRRRPAEVENRLPPGQYLVTDWPVLSAGPTPHTPLDKRSFTMDGLVRKPVTWSWDDFQKLPTQSYTVDISCVTKWTKLDTRRLTAKQRRAQPDELAHVLAAAYLADGVAHPKRVGSEKDGTVLAMIERGTPAACDPGRAECAL